MIDLIELIVLIELIELIDWTDWIDRIHLIDCVYQTTIGFLCFQDNETSLKFGLHHGDYRSKLVHFDAQKIFSMFIKALA